ncbi:unnamed protein product [Prorocentrum cordatum]|uniref:Mei2-like C-terminal RNA recognition motif domain-containing protein n=1 Tax=Prorocentrum cordatum TaxID=2364126 RepID=A0ABN9W4E3_9DINO|nr:unnamed protein product [Polarella glacialis]
MGVDELLQHLVRAGDGRAEALGSRPGERVRQLLLQDIPRRTLKGRRLAGAGPYLGHQVVRLRLLSARIAQRALGDRGAALADRAGSLIDCALERLCAHGGLDPAWWEEELVAQDGAKAKREGSGADDDVYMSVTFRLVVKNSFIEALEVSEDSGGIGVCDLRRTVSDPVLLRPRCGSGSSSSGGVAWPPPVDRRPAPAPRPPLAAPGGGRGVAAGGGDSGAGPEAAVEAPGGALLCGPGCPVEAADADEGRALVMLHAIPDEWTRATVVDFLHCRGAEGRYNFVYLPMDFSRGRCLGYALVNFCEAADAAKLLQDMSGELPSEAPAAGVAGASPRATWNEPSYSVEELVEKYRNSPVMHSTVPEEFKPLLFEKGRRLAFPPPTKAIRPPRIRHSKAASDPRQRPARA